MSEMTVALLRGINVGGKNLLPMKTLAEIFSKAGAIDVKTYIQSGNVLFRSNAAAKVTATVSQQIETRFGWKIPLVVRTAPEINSAIAANPFLNRDLDPSWLHVMFLADQPTQDNLRTLDQARSPGDRSPGDEFIVLNREIYLHLPNGAARTRLTNAWFDTRLKTVSTQRNWRTVQTLAEMMKAG